ncbi:MAG: hypothetical protein AAF153_00200 [Pseudomonadota bacterium]
MRVINLFLIVVLFAISGCQHNISDQFFTRADLNTVMENYDGTILSISNVTISGKDRVADNKDGQILGLGAGALAGSAFGKGSGKTATTALGAVGGAIAGSYAEEYLTKQNAKKYDVALDNGTNITVIQTDNYPLSVGNRVRVVVSGDKKRSRLQPAN